MGIAFPRLGAGRACFVPPAAAAAAPPSASTVREFAVIRFLRSARIAVLLALPLLAACDDGFTAPTRRDIAGTYALASIRVTEGGATTTKPVPLLLYQGPLTVNGTAFSIRYELLSGSIALSETGGTFSYSATYRITEVNGGFAPDTRTVTASGTYLFLNGQIGLTLNAGGDAEIAPGGTLVNGELALQTREPLFGSPGTYLFRR